MLVGLIFLLIIVIVFVYTNPVVNKLQFSTSLQSTRSSSIMTTSIATTAATTVKTTTQSLVKPKVIILAPQNASTVNGNVTISANIIDQQQIKQVQFYVNSTLFATVNSPPYSYVWNTNGFIRPEYTLTVKAYDIANNTGQASVLVDIGLVQHGK